MVGCPLMECTQYGTPYSGRPVGNIPKFMTLREKVSIYTSYIPLRFSFASCSCYDFEKTKEKNEEE